jgi:hypothetical protein
MTKIDTLTAGARYDFGRLEFADWTKGHDGSDAEGYSTAHYFGMDADSDSDGLCIYIGEDEHGIEPLFANVYECPRCGNHNIEATREGVTEGPREYHAECWREASRDMGRDEIDEAWDASRLPC